METQEEFMAATSTNDHTQIVKRKRTKRQRSSSPVCLTVTSCSSTGGGGAVIEDYGSITSSSEIYAGTEEEEEDMANCLILLAQGDFPRQGITDQGKGKISGGRRYGEITSAGGGVYVYECKTCNRSFASFQALGGHRASHKKPKSMVVSGGREMKEESEEQEHQLELDDVIVQTAMKNTKGKIHECSICGSEFASGQALGGHMRRHRANTNNKQQVIISEMKERNMMSLDLDLNLPAPAEEEEEDESRSIELSSNKQGLVFSAPAALVGCHY